MLCGRWGLAALAKSKEGKYYEDRFCCLCARLGLGESPAEYHHVRSGRLGVRGIDGIPLCPGHHRIGPLAIHVMGKKAWQARFGVTEQELLDESQQNCYESANEG